MPASCETRAVSKIASFDKSYLTALLTKSYLIVVTRFAGARALGREFGLGLRLWAFLRTACYAGINLRLLDAPGWCAHGIRF